MELIDLMYRRDMKKGRVSPRVLIHNLQSLIESDNVEVLAFVSMDKNGNVRVGWSEACGVEVIGLFEVAKQHVLDVLKESETK